MTPNPTKEARKPGRQIRGEILEALVTHDILSTQQLALHVDLEVSVVAGQLLWLKQRDSIEHVMYLSDDYSPRGRGFFWNVYWAMTNHGRHHLKKHFGNCRGCLVREMEARAREQVSLRGRVIGELDGS